MKKIIVTEDQAAKLKDTIAKQKHISSFEELISIAPAHVKETLEQLKSFKENPKYHKEDNTYEHVKGVTDQFIHVPAEEQDINMILTGLYHDLGKQATKKPNPKAIGTFQSIGHEVVSARMVRQDAGWIKSLGGDPELIGNLVYNHMRLHQMGVMKPKKVADMKSLPFYDKLAMFGAADNAAKA
jgi:putative nucleotidyltransferase with HDIG domain